MTWSVPSARVFQKLHDQVHVWRLVLSPDKRWQDFQEGLSSEEAGRAERFALPRPALQFSATRACLRKLLSEYLQIPALEIRFGEDIRGKPLLDFPEKTGLDFNVAHSGELSLLAFSMRVPLGVDVEYQETSRDRTSLAQRYFHPSEADRLRTAPETERLTMFYRLWTLKEALLKASGEGLSFGLENIELSGNLQQPDLTFHRPFELEGFAEAQLVALPDPMPGYSAALAMLGKIPESQLFSASL